MLEYPYRIERIQDLEGRHGKRHALTVLGSEPRVSFYCEAESHAGDPWLAASFVYVETEKGGTWGESPLYPTRDGCGFWIGFRASGQLIGDVPADQGDVMRFSDPEFRVRFTLSCRRCGLKTRRRSDSIQGDLATLSRAGVREVALPAYAAMI